MLYLSDELKNLIKVRELLPDEFTGTYWHPEKQDANNTIAKWVLQNSNALIEALEIVERIYPNFRKPGE